MSSSSRVTASKAAMGAIQLRRAYGALLQCATPLVPITLNVISKAMRSAVGDLTCRASACLLSGHQCDAYGTAYYQFIGLLSTLGDHLGRS